MSSSVRIAGWWRGSGTASSVIAPPFQRIVTVARRSSRSTSRMTSSIRQRSSCLRSRSVVVGAAHTRPRSAPSASSCSRSCVGQRAWPLLLAQRELGLGLRELGERVLPVAFQAAGDEAVLGLDLAVASLRAVGLVFGALDLQPPLLQRGVVVGLERFGRLQRGLHAGGGERGQQRAGDRLVDLAATDPQAPAAAALDEDARRGSDRPGFGGRGGLGSGP